MKLHTITIAIAVVGFAGVAAAGQPGENMQPVTTGGTPISECAPPNDQTGHACDGFNRMVRANFTRHEIAALFGYRTGSTAALNGGYERLQKRYTALTQEYISEQQAAGTAVVTVR